MRWVRVWLPVAIMAGGVVAIVASGGSVAGWEGGAAIIGAGMSVWLLNFFFRVGVHGDRERDAEDAARAFFDAHGHWPDEEPPTRTEPPADPHRHPRSDPHGPHPAGRPGGPPPPPPPRPRSRPIRRSSPS
jgi:hypothetical protein